MLALACGGCGKAFGPDGRWLASAGDDGSVRLWTPDTQELAKALLGHAAPVRCLAWSPRKEAVPLASADADGSIRVWEPASGKPLTSWAAHKDPVTALAWLGDHTLASRGEDGTVRLWDAATGGPKPGAAVLQGVPPVLAWSADGTVLATAATASTSTLHAAGPMFNRKPSG
jgi:WD40 repeat protein